MKKIWLRLLLLFLALLFVDKIVLPFYTAQGRQTTVPDVKNLPYDEAVRVLKKAGLEARKSYNVKYLGNVAANVVIDQVPSSASNVKPGRNVYLVLNKLEKPSFVMPDLRSRLVAEARQALERIGLVVEDVQTRMVTNPAEDGKVLSQSVPPGVMVKTGTALSMVVGRLEQEPEGMKRIVVPDVLGMSLDQARLVIAETGLSVGKITYEYSAILVPNTVISQKPTVNTFVPAEQAIELTVVGSE